jgi:elongation factor Ts
MAEINAQLCKALRDRTGAGMMDAKKALEEAGGDIEKAIDVLRTRGLAQAAKKVDRDTNAGAVVVKVLGNKGVAVEVGSETDFVARNERFHNFLNMVVEEAFLADGDVKKTLSPKMEDELANQIATIGERLVVSRMDKVEVGKGEIISYVHNRLAPGIGLIGVLLAIESTTDAAKIREVGEQVAMHIAASAPQFLNIADVDEATLEREKAVAKEKAVAAGKPADIAEKMVAGNIKKYYDEVVLNEQAFFIDPTKKVKDVIASISPDAKIVKFVRFAVGK